MSAEETGVFLRVRPVSHFPFYSISEFLLGLSTLKFNGNVRDVLLNEFRCFFDWQQLLPWRLFLTAANLPIFHISVPWKMFQLF